MNNFNYVAHTQTLSWTPLRIQITQAQLGALVNTLMTVMMGQSQSALMIFTRERPLFLREYSTDHYKILPYFLSKLAAEATQAFAAILVLDLISYFMIGFQMNFFIFFILCYTLALTTTAVCVWLGSMFSDPSMPHALFPLVIVPQFYFSGVFIATNLIPTWVRYVLISALLLICIFLMRMWRDLILLSIQCVSLGQLDTGTIVLAKVVLFFTSKNTMGSFSC